MSGQGMGLAPAIKLAAARMWSSGKLPYYTAAIRTLVFHELPGCGSMGITKDMVLLWDGNYIKGRSVEEVGAFIVHELLHILGRHHERGLASGAEPKMWNRAADYEVNSRLEEAGFPKCDFIHPRDEQFPSGLLAEGYYDLLRQKYPNNDAPQPGPGAGQGSCGSGAGGAPFAGEPGGPGAGSDGNGGGGNSDPFEMPPIPPGRSPQEQDETRREAAESIKQHAASKGRGTVPGGWLTWADTELKPPVVRWEDQLACALRGAVSKARGSAQPTYARPNRRQAGLGYGPGRPLLSSKQSELPRVVVGVDTSGSMGSEEAAKAMAEVDAIIKTLGAPVEFVACDAVIQKTGRAASWKEAAAMLKGGGGTSFVPFFEYVKMMKDKPTSLIIFTDGMGDAPAEAPEGYAVFWVLIGKYVMRPTTWGTYLLTDPEHQKLEEPEEA